MGAFRSLLRKLDADLIERIKNKVPMPVPPVKRVKPNRKAKSYRAARRNTARGSTWKGAATKRGYPDIKGFSKYEPHQGKRECDRRKRQMGGAQ